MFGSDGQAKPGLPHFADDNNRDEDNINITAVQHLFSAPITPPDVRLRHSLLHNVSTISSA